MLSATARRGLRRPIWLAAATHPPLTRTRPALLRTTGWIQADSSNYDDSGFFSSQVIGKALENLGLEMTPITHPDMADAKGNPLQETALICWLSSHWFTIRKIGPQQWWNLNSQLQQPERVTDTYLGMLIHQLISEGYTVFVVRGNIPQPPAVPQPLPSSLSYGGGSGNNDGGMEMDPELAMAIAASMGDMQRHQASAGGGGGGGHAAVVVVDDDGEDGGEDEEELRKAIAMSLAADNEGNTHATAAAPAAAAAAPLTAEEVRAKRLARFG